MKNKVEFERKYTFKEPRDCKVSDMIYPDRGMMKWQGFILSDHNEAMDDEKGYDEIVINLRSVDAQEYEKWNFILMKSMKEKVLVNFEYISEEHKVKYFKGMLKRYNRDFLFITDGESFLKINKKMFINIYL